MAVNQQRRAALKRLKADLDELTRSPIAGIAAAPLEDDMLEWHCNILLGDVAQHLILFFPEEYPCKPPSAEFVPRTFHYGGGATLTGKKGTQICMPMFSDYQNVHREWEKEAVGWSPGHTVQTCLLGALSFLSQYSNGQKASSKKYTCPDCGHSNKTPYPRLQNETSLTTQSARKGKASTTPRMYHLRSQSTASSTTYAEVAAEPSYMTRIRKNRSDLPQGSMICVPPLPRDDLNMLTEKYHIADYISKDRFSHDVKPVSNHDIFGYGFAIENVHSQPSVTSPCEVISAASFNLMKETRGFVHSIAKRELVVFLPLYLCSNHASGIKDIFEQAMKDMGASIFPKGTDEIAISKLVLEMIPVVLGNIHLAASSDSSIQGYFAMHRLMLWAIETYSDLPEMLESQIQDIIDNVRYRPTSGFQEIFSLLALLTVSNKYRWEDTATLFLSAFWQQQIKTLFELDYKLGESEREIKRRITNNGDSTLDRRRQLAFQVEFLSIAMPQGMTRDDVIKRYDANLGFPTDDMVAEMKNAIQSRCKLIPDDNIVKWFKGTDAITITDILKTLPVFLKKTHMLTLNDSRLQGYCVLHHILILAGVTYIGSREVLETRIKRYFAIHHLLLAVVDTYSDIQEILDTQLQEFLEQGQPAAAHSGLPPFILMLSVSHKYRWPDIAKSYMAEFWHRLAPACVKEDIELGVMTTDIETRIRKTLDVTLENRKQLALQVCFLHVAMPPDMLREEAITRSDADTGYPSDDMVARMNTCIDEIDKLTESKDYIEWFKLLNLKPPSENELFEELKNSVISSKSHIRRSDRLLAKRKMNTSLSGQPVNDKKKR